VAYRRPGDPAMETLIAHAAHDARAVLLANHGPVVSAATLTDAVHAAEELEEAARLALLLHGRDARTLDAAQIEDLLANFG
jgi:ribulose-5-phosphate 4-epimerase/fuculose-1-phosphate aldolase